MKDGITMTKDNNASPLTPPPPHIRYSSPWPWILAAGISTCLWAAIALTAGWWLGD
jgi:hypothetical protein